jgi:hypothetical protein
MPTLLGSAAATCIVVCLILLASRGCNDLCKKKDSISPCCCYLHCFLVLVLALHAAAVPTWLLALRGGAAATWLLGCNDLVAFACCAVTCIASVACYIAASVAYLYRCIALLFFIGCWLQ